MFTVTAARPRHMPQSLAARRPAPSTRTKTRTIPLPQSDPELSAGTGIASRGNATQEISCQSSLYYHIWTSLSISFLLFPSLAQTPGVFGSRGDGLLYFCGAFWLASRGSGHRGERISEVNTSQFNCLMSSPCTTLLCFLPWRTFKFFPKMYLFWSYLNMTISV